MTVNKVLFFFFILINTLVLLSGIMYLKLSLIDHIVADIYIKWIPTLLLFIQSTYLFIYYTIRDNKPSARYALYLCIGYVFCICGDVLLAFNNIHTFMGGMAFFFLFYLIFGLIRAGEVYKFIRNSDAIEEYDFGRLLRNKPMMCLFIIIEAGVGALCFAYLIMQVIHNNQYDHPLFFFVVAIYFLVMLFASTCHLVYLFIYKNLKHILAYVGIFTFMLSDFLVLLDDVKYNNIPLQCVYMVLYWLALMLIGASIYLPEVEKLEYVYW